jgi:hypothetical protein
VSSKNLNAPEANLTLFCFYATDFSFISSSLFVTGGIDAWMISHGIDITSHFSYSQKILNFLLDKKCNICSDYTEQKWLQNLKTKSRGWIRIQEKQKSKTRGEVL